MKHITNAQIDEMLYQTIYVEYDGHIDNIKELEDIVKLTLDINNLLPWRYYYNRFIEISIQKFYL